MKDDSWKVNAVAELMHAEEARKIGNEGLARVCARRAAGHIADEYLQRQGIQLDTSSVLTKLKFLSTSPTISHSTADIVNHFLIHTTPEHNLPIEADLINDVRVLSEVLLEEKIEQI
jgi:hypothetical protein